MPPSRWIEALKSELRISKKKHADRDEHPVEVSVVEVAKDHSREESSSSLESASDSSSPLSTDDSSDQGIKTQLPEPFYPVSLLLQKDDAQVAVAKLPENLGVAAVPGDVPPTDIDAQDAGGPDGWVPRDPRMVRLTGKHPFNAEARISDLFSQGFFTSTNLFFVRNHGAVPKVDLEAAKDWKVEFTGLCNNTSLSLEDLRTKFEVVTIPITLVCAGNRRKEQNVVQKSLGFSWGAGGVSTALFTGVRLCDVLQYIRPHRGARHVVFEGADQLPNGPYGTSQLLSWATDPNKGMMLAWAMNGKTLEPDHGYPIRLVVPSQIGGRSVKWLTKIELSAIESQHHLHFHDNKVLPMPVGPDQARAEKSWWYDPRYIIRDLNVNSAIACPNHDEVLDASPSDTYTLRGYAYGGGGRRVTRIEISLDEGSTWRLAEIEYPEDKFREFTHDDPIYGKLDLSASDFCFCWCFWSFPVTVEELGKAAAITVRAMDEGMAVQPRDMYWNATGMMNNWWFRVVVHHLDGGKMRFEHPTMAGTQPGGWMQRIKDEGRDPAQPRFGDPAPVTPPKAASGEKPVDVVMTKPGVNRKITKAELAEHTGPENPWFVVQGEVYDATTYLNEHPGGPQSITLVAGDDATEDFLAIHSADAKRKLAEYHIGTLEGSLVEETKESPVDDAIFLNPKQWKKSKLVSVKDVSKDSKVFRFALDNEEQALGLPTGQHVYVRLRRKTETSGKKVADGDLVQRAYTPLSREMDKGYIDMLVKIYYPSNVFPTGGKMTVGFAELDVGDTVELKGPIGHFTWVGNGSALLHGKKRTLRQVGMICAGSGITPILQVLRGIFEDPSDTTTEAWVLDINRYEDDILCREELDALAAQNPTRLHLRYSLTGQPMPSNWVHSVGRLDLQMIETYLPKASEEGIVCICGPPPMEQAGKDSLTSLGWNPQEQVVIF